LSFFCNCSKKNKRIYVRSVFCDRLKTIVVCLRRSCVNCFFFWHEWASLKREWRTNWIQRFFVRRPLKGSKSLKIFKISLTTWRSQILAVSNKKIVSTYTGCHRSPRNKFDKRFLHINLLLIEYFFYIFLTPTFTLCSWDNHQLKRENVFVR
jgi:hypothetical protein